MAVNKGADGQAPRAGRHRHRPFRVRVRVGFVPRARGPHSTAFVTVTFR